MSQQVFPGVFQIKSAFSTSKHYGVASGYMNFSHQALLFILYIGWDVWTQVVVEKTKKKGLWSAVTSKGNVSGEARFPLLGL